MRLESAIWSYPEQAPCLADQGLLIRCDACLRFLSSHPEFPSRGVSLSRGYLVVLCSIRGLGYQHFSYNFPPSAGFERQLLLDLSALCLKDGRCDLSSSFSMQNIFLTQDGKVKLGDFGSARLLSRYVCLFLFYSSDCCQNIIIQKCSVIILYLFMVLAPWRLLVHTWEHLIMCPQKFGKTCLITIKGK